MPPKASSGSKQQQQPQKQDPQSQSKGGSKGGASNAKGGASSSGGSSSGKNAAATVEQPSPPPQPVIFKGWTGKTPATLLHELCQRSKWLKPVWETETRKDSQELRGHSEAIDQVCWDPSNPDRLITLSVDKSFRVWDTRAGKCTHIINTGGENINVAWRGDGGHLAIGTKEDVIFFYDARQWKLENKISFSCEINEISWNTVGDLFFTTTSLGTVGVFEYPSMKEIHSINAHTVNCHCIKFDPQGRWFATGSADAIVSLWDVNEFVCLRTFTGLGSPMRSISFSHDGQYLAYASEDPFVEISHSETGADVIRIPAYVMNAVAWHPSKYILAYATEEPDVRSGLKLWTAV